MLRNFYQGHDFYGRGFELVEDIGKLTDASGSFDFQKYRKKYDRNGKGKENISANEQLALDMLVTLVPMSSKCTPVYDFVKKVWNWDLAHATKSTTSFCVATKSDLRSGNLDVAVRRSISFLAMAAFDKLDHDNYRKDSRLTVDLSITTSRIDDGITPDALKSAFQIIFSVFVFAGNFDAAAKFLDRAIFDVAFDTMQHLIQLSLQERNLEYAKMFLGKLEVSEPRNPKIQAIRAEVERLEKFVHLKQEKKLDFDHIVGMTGIEFENLLFERFEELGFFVSKTPMSGDFGVDLIVETKSATRIVVQCKRYSSKLNLKAVQEVIGGMSHYSADFGVVVTTVGYLQSAVKLAQSVDVELWGGDELARFLSDGVGFSQMASF